MGSSQGHLSRQIFTKYYEAGEHNSFQCSSTQNPNDSLPNLMHP